MNNNLLNKYGFQERFQAEATMYPDYFAGRVIAQYSDLYRVVTSESEFLAEVSGRFRHQAARPSEFPAVGDFVMLNRSNGQGGNGIIHHVLTRKSLFERKAVGAENHSQVVCTNIDVLFLCMSLNQDFNLRRMERYLSVAWDSGAVPVIILTKSDLCADLTEKLAELESVAIGVDVMTVSKHDSDSYAAVNRSIRAGQTVSFIGSSGVGKSTLINCLLGKEHFETNEIRNDSKGRHTTTRREMILLPDGGIVIDTPGMKELGIESADFSKSFQDIDELAGACRFSDCRHQEEPGCAVRQAIADGILDELRLESYRKLKKEARYENMNSRQIAEAKWEDIAASVGGAKNLRKLIHEKGRQKFR